MIEETDFETYLYVSKNKFQIFVLDKKKLKNLYIEEQKLHDKFDFQDFNILSKFLDENIYKIEKLVGNFIKNIFLIIENDNNFHVNIAVKKKNYEDTQDQRYLKNSLTDLKDLFRENYSNFKIMHMVIVDYTINKDEGSSFEKNSNNSYLCLELNFIIISNNLTYALEKILEKYQVNIRQYICGTYAKKIFEEDNLELSEMACKIKNGVNQNEVILISKDAKNKGFFERFFQLFS